MVQFKISALGGTFDIIHRGHVELLRKSFSMSSKVIIGLTSDEFAQKRGKHPANSYQNRYATLVKTIKENFPDVIYEISKLENDFGPAVLEKDVEALILSDETSRKGEELNRLRKERNIPQVEVVIIPMVLAKDGKRISTTRIKNLEIDSEGNILDVDK